MSFGSYQGTPYIRQLTEEEKKKRNAMEREMKESLDRYVVFQAQFMKEWKEWEKRFESGGSMEEFNEFRFTGSAKSQALDQEYRLLIDRAIKAELGCCIPFLCDPASYTPPDDTTASVASGGAPLPRSEKKRPALFDGVIKKATEDFNPMTDD